MKKTEVTLVLLIVIVGLFTSVHFIDFPSMAHAENYSNEGVKHSGYNYVWNETITEDASDLTSLNLKNINGFIKIDPQSHQDAKEIEVDAVITIVRKYLSTEQNIIDAKKSVGISVERTENEITIRADHPKIKPTGVSNIKIDMTVKVPSTLAVHAEGINGEITIQNIQTPVSLKTINGKIASKACPALVKVESVNGQINLSGIKKKIQCKAVNGRIHATFDAIPNDSSSFETVNGAVHVTLPKGSGIDLHLETMNGSLRFDDQAFQGEKKKKKVHGELNGGGPEFRVKTLNGSITIQS